MNTHRRQYARDGHEGEAHRAVGDAIRQKKVVADPDRAAGINDVGDITFAVLVRRGQDSLSATVHAP